MELFVYDENFNVVTIFDSYDSLIWIERYFGYGEFEIYTLASKKWIDAMKENYYLWLKESTQTMIIENIQLRSDLENGSKLVVTGRSFESILDRRIIWRQTILNGNFQNGIERLLNDNIINPSDSTRKVPILSFEKSDDPRITALKIDTQFTGDNLYEAIYKLCEMNNVGFRITLTNDFKLVFKMYYGSDRSYDQTDNVYVVFSSKFDNLVDSNYTMSGRDVKTVTLVAGEGEGEERRTITVPAEGGALSGLNRRELFTDARDISSEVEDQVLTDDEYNQLLTQRGEKNLSDYKRFESFDGKADTERLFVYGKDFFIGDIVQLAELDYNVNAKARITELTRSKSSSGVTVYPTFEVI